MTKFKTGDLVYIPSQKQKGKVIAVTKYTPQSYKVEIIKNFNKETGERITKLMTFKAEELRSYRRRKQRKYDSKPLEIKIKYFDKDYPHLQEIAIGDLIDLRSRERIEYKKGDFFMIPLGVAMEIPVGWKADVFPRSSTFKNWGLIQTNSVGKIDQSYSGDEDEWKLPVYATRDGVIEKYDRVCQFELTRKQPKIAFKTVESLNNPNRGGFGSTGTK